MVFGPWVQTWAWMKANLVPKRFKLRRPRFNFITLHYLYMIVMTIIGSILIFPAGGLTYIDALLFASGSVTQSGLNPVDVNKLFLYQQLVIFFITCVCTPIFINTFVVFVRLYWFEKRFQNIVQEARQNRRDGTRSRTRSEAKSDHDVGREEKGVGNRKIVVLRGSNGFAPTAHDQHNESAIIDDEGDESHGDQASGMISPRTRGPSSPKSRDEFPTFHRDIVFADEVEPSRTRTLSNSDRVPERRPAEQHIAFVDNKRNPKDKGTLRIPGPRDFDRGDLPQRVEDSEDGFHPGRLARQVTGEDESNPPNSAHREQELNMDDHPRRRSTLEDGEEPRLSRLRYGLTAVKAPFNFSRSLKSTGSQGVTHIRNRARSRTFGSMATTRSQERDPMPYLSWTPTIGRNSAFVDLTEEQREELGGIEYRALKTLAFILVFYFVGLHLIGTIVLLPWILRTETYGKILPPNGVNKVWWAFFTPASMFNDLGFTLTPDSMISFQSAVVPMLLGSFLIIAGNTGFPCLLRLIIWIASKCVRHGTALWEELQFLLDHPRRCFTLLFPSDATWWLFWVLVLLNGLDLIFFIILDLNDPTVTSLSPGYRVLDGLFQAASTRTAGFSCVNLADLHPAIQVSYLIMMYISVFPIAISMRRTNVYEEKSLGVYADPEEEESQQHSYVGTHLRRQLSFDLWYVFMGFFFIAIIEGGRLENTNDYAFTLFSVLFEIVSAYGTVGMSLGYPGINASFCSEFKVLSKLIIIAMQLRGRHRGLPYALDRAILLPSESLHKKEDLDAMIRARRNSNVSDAAFVDGVLVRPMSQSGASALGVRPLTDRQRRSSHASTVREMDRERRDAGGLSRLISGALSAGPTIARDHKDRDREKKA